MHRCSSAARARGTYIPPRLGALCGLLRNGPGLRFLFHHIGCAMPMPATPLTGAARSTWSRLPWDTPQLPPRENIFMPEQTIVLLDIWGYEWYQAVWIFTSLGLLPLNELINLNLEV